MDLFDRGDPHRREQQVPDERLQKTMLEDVLDADQPGTAVLLTGDGGFLPTLERMHKKGWAIEVLSWEHACKRSMREWVTKNGVFVPLDKYYKPITYLKNLQNETIRDAEELNLTDRQIVEH